MWGQTARSPAPRAPSQTRYPLPPLHRGRAIACRGARACSHNERKRLCSATLQPAPWGRFSIAFPAPRCAHSWRRGVARWVARCTLDASVASTPPVGGRRLYGSLSLSLIRIGGGRDRIRNRSDARHKTLQRLEGGRNNHRVRRHCRQWRSRDRAVERPACVGTSSCAPIEATCERCPRQGKHEGAGCIAEANAGRLKPRRRNRKAER